MWYIVIVKCGYATLPTIETKFYSDENAYRAELAILLPKVEDGYIEACDHGVVPATGADIVCHNELATVPRR